MKKFALGFLLVLTVSSIGGLVWQLTRPIEDLTWVRLQVAVDPALPGPKVWLGEGEITPGSWIELSGRLRRRHEITEFSELWTLDPRQLTRVIEPRATLVETAADAPLYTEVLVAHGDYPVRGYTGIAEVNSAEHPWLWLIAGEPTEARPCGVALRAESNGRPLVARDVILPVLKQREESTWEQVLLRRRVTERTIIVEFGLPH